MAVIDPVAVADVEILLAAIAPDRELYGNPPLSAALPKTVGL